MRKKTQGVIFLILSISGFGNLVSKLNQPTPTQEIDVFSIGLPVLFFVIGIVLLILGIRENSNRPYE